jgi:hypothetical protein
MINLLDAAISGLSLRLSSLEDKANRIMQHDLRLLGVVLVVAISGRILDGLIGANQMPRAPLSFSDCGEL